MTSILKVSEIQDPTNSNTALTINATGEVKIPGSVVQVVQATTATSYSAITSTSFVELSSDLRCTITPKFSDSLLLVMFHSMMYKSGSPNPWGVATIYRDGSDIFGGSYGPGYTQGVGANTSMIHNARKIVSANSTSSTTFSLYIKAGSGYTMNMDSADRQVMVMEIAQ